MQDCVKEVRDLESSYEDINALIELTEEEEDREMIKEIQREIAKFEKEFEDGGINFDIFSKEESSGEYTYIMYFYYGKEKYIVIGRNDEERIRDIVIAYKNVILSHEGNQQ